MKLIYLSITILLLSCSSDTKKTNNISKALKLLDKQKVVYRNTPTITGEMTGFRDRTKSYGLEGLKASSISVIDFNNDSYSDLVLIKDYFSQPEFYEFNITKKKFMRVESLFDKQVKASSLVFSDLNNDNILDVVVSVLNQKSELTEKPIQIFFGKHHQDRLKFFLSKDKFPIKAKATTSIGLIDYDLDGDMDLFIGNWLSKYKNTSLPQEDYLLENKKGKFSNTSDLLIGEHSQNPSKTMYVNTRATYGVQVCDIDQNGFPDIVSVSSNGFKNRLWMNEYALRKGKRKFRDYGVYSNIAGDNSGSLNINGGGRTFSLACGDYNNDQIMDIFLGELSHSYDQEGKDKSSILTGSTFKFPPKFVRTEYFEDSYDLSWNQADRRGLWFDYNNDGLLDLLVDNTGFPPHTRLTLFKQFSDHSFLSVGKDLGIDFVNPQSSVIIDLNKDGNMDVISAQQNLRDASIKPRLYVFENHVKNKNKSIRFFLRGKNSNYFGINASIRLKIKNENSKVVNRTMPVSYSYGSFNPKNEEGIHFGLKHGETLLGVKVIWPYSKKANINRAGLEKYYNLSNINMQKTINITLCEKGDYLIGRLNCI